jgi:hypothetical protein
MKMLLLAVVAAGSLAASAALGGQAFDAQGAAAFSGAQPQAQVQGRIVSIRSAAIIGEPWRHVLVTLLTPDGRLARADLGRTQDLRDRKVTLVWDEAVLVQGRWGKLNGFPVLLGTTVSSPRSGQAFLAPPRQLDLRTPMATAFQQRREQFRQRVGVAQQQFQQQGQPPSGFETSAELTAKPMDKGQVIMGIVENVQERQVPNDKTPHVFVQVRTQDGQLVTMDVGTRQELANVNLQKGAFFGAHGQFTSLGGQSVLFATEIANPIQIKGRQPQAQDNTGVPISAGRQRLQ